MVSFRLDKISAKNWFSMPQRPNTKRHIRSSFLFYSQSLLNTKHTIFCRRQEVNVPSFFLFCMYQITQYLFEKNVWWKKLNDSILCCEIEIAHYWFIGCDYVQTDRCFFSVAVLAVSNKFRSYKIMFNRTQTAWQRSQSNGTLSRTLNTLWMNEMKMK